MKFIKYKTLIIIVLCLVVSGVLARYGYKQYREHKFLSILEKAANIDTNSWFEKYKDVKVNDKYKVVFVANNGGEYSYAEYFKYSAEKLGWKVKVYTEKITGYEKEILAFDPDFIIFSVFAEMHEEQKITAHRSKKYLLNLTSFRNLREHKKINKNNPCEVTINDDLEKLIYMAHGLLTATKEVDVFRCMFARMDKAFNGFMMLPSAPELINEPSEPINIMWGGMGWDKFRSSKNYKNFITLLSDNLPMKIYGSYGVFNYLKPHVYDGYISPGMENINAIRKNGIYLLTHSDWHFKGGEPSMRPFEAAAANAVVISDKHPFAIEHFGDSFLYFDQNADSETMYKQVKAHYDWIKANPEKAKAMAARAHQIFLEKFTLEKDLVRIAKMHEYVVKQEKEMGLSYPLAY